MEFILIFFLSLFIFASYLVVTCHFDHGNEEDLVVTFLHYKNYVWVCVGSLYCSLKFSFINWKKVYNVTQ